MKIPSVYMNPNKKWVIMNDNIAYLRRGDVVNVVCRNQATGYDPEEVVYLYKDGNFIMAIVLALLFGGKTSRGLSCYKICDELISFYAKDPLNPTKEEVDMMLMLHPEVKL